MSSFLAVSIKLFKDYTNVPLTAFYNNVLRTVSLNSYSDVKVLIVDYKVISVLQKIIY